jgi:hypothetical protein
MLLHGCLCACVNYVQPETGLKLQVAVYGG